ncbi:MAG: hypothetical protein P8J79_04565 [Halioglobus sp.]|nr:hypothetical protein [Halioglobus sp.]
MAKPKAIGVAAPKIDSGTLSETLTELRKLFYCAAAPSTGQIVPKAFALSGESVEI